MEVEMQEPVVRIFRGNDSDQFEAYVQFFDEEGYPLSTKHLCSQESDSQEEFTEDRYVLDLESFYFYEWENVGRIECHSDIKDICLSEKLRPKVGTIEFLDERRRDFIKRGRFSFIDDDDVITQYDIKQFFDRMEWVKPEFKKRKCKFDLMDFGAFPVKIESHFQDRSFDATVRFFDAVGNQIEVEQYCNSKEFEDEQCFEDWTVIELGRFLKDQWANVAVVECRSDLSAIDRFRHVKGNIDYLIYCRANNYKKLPEYLYKRIQTRKLDEFLTDIKG